MLETIASHLDAFESIVPVWGLALVFAFMAVESSFIPFPSEVVMIPAGFFAARGAIFQSSPALALAAAIAAGVAGSLAGAYVNYGLSLWLGKPFLEKYGRYFFVKKKHLDRACELFNKYGAATTFVCRLVPVVRQLISIPAGIAKMPLRPFTVFTALGSGVWSTVLALAGYALGRSAGDMTYLELVQKGRDAAVSHLPLVICCSVVLVLAYWLVARLAAGGKDGEC